VAALGKLFTPLAFAEFGRHFLIHIYVMSIYVNKIMLFILDLVVVNLLLLYGAQIIVKMTFLIVV